MRRDPARTTAGAAWSTPTVDASALSDRPSAPDATPRQPALASRQRRSAVRKAGRQSSSRLCDADLRLIAAFDIVAIVGGARAAGKIDLVRPAGGELADIAVLQDQLAPVVAGHRPTGMRRIGIGRCGRQMYTSGGAARRPHTGRWATSPRFGYSSMRVVRVSSGSWRRGCPRPAVGHGEREQDT